MAIRVLDGIKFCGQVLKRTSQGTFLPSLVQIGPVVWEEKMFKEIVDDARRTTDDGHLTTLKAPLEHVVLRLAKNYEVRARNKNWQSSTGDNSTTQRSRVMKMHNFI